LLNGTRLILYQNGGLGLISMTRKLNIIIPAILVLGGCASMVSDASQPISIDTPNCKQAKCHATNSEGVYYAPETPATIVVNKAYGDLTLICEKNGKSETSLHKSSANAATFGNILLGGIPGALIDGGTGKGYDYPSHIINNLSCDNIPSENIKKSTDIKTKRLNLDESQIKCADLGFKPKTEKFGECVLKLTGN